MAEIPVAAWYEKAAVAIVRDGKTLYAWANETRKGLRKEECDEISRTKEFQAALRAERNRLYKELATDPSRSRNTAVGQLLFAIQRLIEAEQYDKAVTALAQLFKAEGWSSDQAQISIFNGLDSRDIGELRKKLQEKAEKNG